MLERVSALILSSTSAKSSFVPIVMGANAIHTTSLFVTQVPCGIERPSKTGSFTDTYTYQLLK